MKKDKEFAELIERKVRQTIKKNQLLYKNQKIGVGVSGGKDSMSTLFILKNLGYNVEAFIVDHGIGEYAKTNLENTKKLCKKLGVVLNIISIENIFGKSLTDMKKNLDKQGFDYSYCMICGILKRYILNKNSQEHNLDVLVTGHNLDDEAQAFIMNIFRNDFKLAIRQGPMPGIIESNKFTTRVKPMFFIAEEDIKRYALIKKLPVNYNSCPYSKTSYRHDFKKMLNTFEKRNPSIKYNILHFQQKMKSMLNLETLPEIGTCSECKEPSSRDICKTCELIKKL
ncbi:MAG: TIGR00269 family protein [Nanoarchaeota archaeon]